MLAFILRTKKSINVKALNRSRLNKNSLRVGELKVIQYNCLSSSTHLDIYQRNKDFNSKVLDSKNEHSESNKINNKPLLKGTAINYKDRIANFKAKAVKDSQGSGSWSTFNSISKSIPANQTLKTLNSDKDRSSTDVKPWLNRSRLLSRSDTKLAPLTIEENNTKSKPSLNSQGDKSISFDFNTEINSKKVIPNRSKTQLGVENSDMTSNTKPERTSNLSDFAYSSKPKLKSEFNRETKIVDIQFKSVSNSSTKKIESKKSVETKDAFSKSMPKFEARKQSLNITFINEKGSLQSFNHNNSTKKKDAETKSRYNTFDPDRNQISPTQHRAKTFTEKDKLSHNFVPADDLILFKDRHSKISKPRESHHSIKLKSDGKKSHRNQDDDENEAEPPVRIKVKKANFLPVKSKDVFLPPLVKVGDLAKLFNVTYDLVKRKMLECGLPEHPHSYLMKSDDAALVAMALNLNPIIEDDVTLKDLYRQNLPPYQPDGTPHSYRTPVVTIMGHVDHGKTTLLDKLRSANVAAGEAGGITQHIGAFQVSLGGNSDRHITFLDTPGHAAFRQMRYRGANVTDIVVLVVAADDGIMPQTIEAINHTLEAKVPMIVAVTKCDKPTKDLDKIKESLLQHNVQLEMFGGDTQVVELSAVTGKGILELEEAIVTLAEILDLRAPTSDFGVGKDRVEVRCEAVVLESSVDKGLGPVATVVVNSGTLRPGTLLVAGEAWCKVKGLVDDRGQQLKLVLPGTPAQVSGWRALPDAGDVALQAKDEDEVKLVVSSRQRKRQMELEFKSIESINEKRYQDHIRMQQRAANPDAELEEEFTVPVFPTLPIILKGDVSGTVEAIEESISQLPSTKAVAKVIHRGVGPVTKADLDVAVAAKSGFILTFNVKTDKEVIQAARNGKVELRNHRIIYKLLEEVKTRLLELIPATYQYSREAEAEVKQIFDMKLKGRGTVKIAGCRISKGTLKKEHLITVSRPGGGRDGSDVVREQVAIATLKHFKDDVNSVKEGTECAIELRDFDNIKAGDKLIVFDKVELPKSL